MALYRSQNANQNGGPTQSSIWPLSNLWIENTDPRQAKHNGANHYLYVSGWGGGNNTYDLPENWYLGNYGTSIITETLLTGFAIPNGATMGQGMLATGLMTIAKKNPVAAFGGPLGYLLFTMDLGELSTWDTNYFVANGYWGPAQPVLTP